MPNRQSSQPSRSKKPQKVQPNYRDVQSKTVTSILSPKKDSSYYGGSSSQSKESKHTTRVSVRDNGCGGRWMSRRKLQRLSNNCVPLDDDDDDDDEEDVNDGCPGTTNHDCCSHPCCHHDHSGNEWCMEPDPSEYPIIKRGPPCMTLPQRPCVTWEKEIVKFDPCGRWDPKVKEKGNTGRPERKGSRSKKKKRGGNQGNNGGEDDEGNEDGDDARAQKSSGSIDDSDSVTPLAIGESVHAYKCYIDQCVPQGLVYCTPKRPKHLQNCDPLCPQSWPKRPDRVWDKIPICPEKEGTKGQNNGQGQGSCNDGCQSSHSVVDFGSRPTMQDCDCRCDCCGCDCCDEDMCDDPCCPHCQSGRGMNDAGHGHSRHHGCGQSSSRCCDSGSGPNQKAKLPEEWLMHVPRCDVGPSGLPPIFGEKTTITRPPCKIRRN